jgi:thymidine kinase
MTYHHPVGHLKTIAGPMYAGKTSAILQEILWIKHCNNNVLVLKPNIDKRYSANNIETHNQLSFPCFSMDNWDHVIANHTLQRYNFHTVFVDEIQFMDSAQTVKHVQQMLLDGVNVVCAGLDQDSRGKPFETTAMMLALSDEVEKITAICTICGRPATKTQRNKDKGDRVAVGSVGMYEPRCLTHWKPR